MVLVLKLGRGNGRILPRSDENEDFGRGAKVGETPFPPPWRFFESNGCCDRSAAGV